jgi:hypothetical protein
MARGMMSSSGIRGSGSSSGPRFSSGVSQSSLAQKQQERANRARAFRLAADRARDAGNTSLAATNYLKAANAGPATADGQAARAALEDYEADATARLAEAKDFLADENFDRAGVLLRELRRDYAPLAIGGEIDQALRKLERTKNRPEASPAQLEARRSVTK